MSLEKLLHAHGHEAQHELHHYEESYWTTRQSLKGVPCSRSEHDRDAHVSPWPTVATRGRRDSWCSQLSQLAELPG